MRIEQLEYLMKISQMNNMTKAANALHISQPSLSESIRRLEKELDIKLLERHHKGVVLTEAGECVIESTKKVFKELNFMQIKLEALKADASMDAKEISIDTTPFIGNAYFYDFWRGCKERLNWDVKFKQYDARKILERLASGRSTMGVVLIERHILEKVQAEEKHLDFYLLEPGYVKVVFSNQHPLTRYETVPMDELIKYPLLLPKNECIPVRQIFEQYGSFEHLVESDLYMLPHRFVQDHKGMCLLSTILLEYFDDGAFDRENLAIRELEIEVSSDLYFIMEKNYAKTENGVACRKEVERYFTRKFCRK